jgi:selenide, water dikinase
VPAESLVEVLKAIPQTTHAWVDSSPGPLDDAAILRPAIGRSLVFTIDVITPIVDDPRTFGVIAAANAMSDVWAMGGRPEVALSFIGFPTDKLPLEALAEVLAGMNDACAKAGVAIAGGHTIADTEPKAGLAVVGSVDPARVWSHRGAREGQALILTKPLGTGVIGQAIRAGAASDASVAEAVAQMTTLSGAACAIGLDAGATSCTDVTGFGLLGHLGNILAASSLDAELDARAVPLLEGAHALAAAGTVPGGSKRNLKQALSITSFDDAIDDATRLLLADAQTSGGLLLCVPEDRAQGAIRRLHDEGSARAAIIGRLSRANEEGPRIRVTSRPS